MKKNIVMFSTWDNEGSGVAAFKIASFLIEAGHNVVLMVRDKTRTDNFIIQLPRRAFSLKEKIIRKIKPAKNIDFATIQQYSFLNKDEDHAYVSVNYILERLSFTPDFIFTGIIGGFINTNTLVALKKQTGAQVYMFALDMAVLTGGCHYAWECKGYQKECCNCPAIVDNDQKIIAENNLRIKNRNVIQGDIQIITLSNWSLLQAKKSILFKNQKDIYNVNSIIDTAFFTSKHRDFAKRVFNLPQSSKVIFTGAAYTNDKRKGISYFIEALNYLYKDLEPNIRENTVVMMAGNHNISSDVLKKIPFNTHLIDYIKDYRLLSLAYQATDVFICSSIEDAGPMMVSEALSSGTPVVSFNMGVASQLVVQDYNGYIAELKNSEDLSAGIKKILTLTKEEFQLYSDNAVEQVEKYSSKKFFLETIEKIFNQKVDKILNNKNQIVA